MFDAIVELFPAEWRATVTVLLSPVRWIPELQSTLLRASIVGDSVVGVVLLSATLLLPALLIIVGLWCTMLSLYTLPFRSGRGSFVTALLLAWWDAGRCIWLFWMGFVRVGVALLGWVIGMLRFAWLFFKNLVVGMVRSPFSLLDWTTRRYFQPGVPWIAFLVLLLWTGVEATIFTFTLNPTLNEVFAGLTGFEPNPSVMIPLLWVFLFMLVAGSFACMQVLSTAVRQKKVSDIVQMVIVESAVMFFEVIFLYREMIDAITPWIAQQTGGEVRLGLAATLGLASFGWMGVRGMSWFLFGRFGTPALLAVIARQTITHDSTARDIPAPVQPALWKAPVEALKAETAWFHAEAKRMLELLSLPVLQLLASAVNFAVMIVQSHGVFTLPFKTLDDMLAATHFASRARHSGERPVARRAGGVPTPRDPMPRVAS
jgi:hypothetical protein